MTRKSQKTRHHSDRCYITPVPIWCRVVLDTLREVHRLSKKENWLVMNAGLLALGRMKPEDRRKMLMLAQDVRRGMVEPDTSLVRLGADHRSDSTSLSHERLEDVPAQAGAVAA
jgi:hypothetical protein